MRFPLPVFYETWAFEFTALSRRDAQSQPNTMERDLRDYEACLYRISWSMEKVQKEECAICFVGSIWIVNWR